MKAAIERRLVRQLAALHGVSLSDDAVSALANDPGDGLLLDVAKGIVTFPFKLIFRQLFIVSEVKRAGEAAHRVRGVVVGGDGRRSKGPTRTP